MAKEQKIDQLRQAFMAGEVMTPLRAWERFHMAHNTYHRSIYGLKHGKRPLNIDSEIIEENGTRYSKHWLHINQNQ